MSPRVPWLQTRWDSSGVPCVLWLRIPPPCVKGLELPCALRPPVGLKHEEKTSMPTCETRFTSSQHTRACFQGA
jgi:hypothetical protein